MGIRNRLDVTPFFRQRLPSCHVQHSVSLSPLFQLQPVNQSDNLDVRSNGEQSGNRTVVVMPLGSWQFWHRLRSACRKRHNTHTEHQSRTYRMDRQVSWSLDGLAWISITSF
jgi:hypothetical protein